MPFDSPITVSSAPNGTDWYLLHPVIYQGKHQTWTVPAGQLTDFASVPRFLQWIAPHQGIYTPGAVLHDWFCDVAIRQKLISARDADAVFRRVMRELGVGRLQRWLMWLGVRYGALASKDRRTGWWRDLPAVVGLTAVALPLVAPAALVVLAQLALNKLVGVLADV